MNKALKIITGVLVAWALSPKRAYAFSESFAERDSYLGHHSLPRGIRNNNPGNLKITPIQWQGKIPAARNTDGVFEQFERYVYGIRAMMKDILGDMREGKDTLRKIINEYAPTSENQTSAYVAAVSAATGWGPDTRLQASYATMARLIPAMVFHENGMPAVTQRQLEAAWALI